LTLMAVAPRRCKPPFDRKLPAPVKRLVVTYVVESRRRFGFQNRAACCASFRSNRNCSSHPGNLERDILDHQHRRFDVYTRGLRHP
jgi:hypothetical protein